METMIIASAARAIRHVFIRDMILPASIGVHAHEHEAAQRVRINIDLGVEDDGVGGISRPRVARESLLRVVDYGAVADTVRAIVAAGHIVLVELSPSALPKRALPMGVSIWRASGSRSLTCSRMQHPPESKSSDADRTFPPAATAFSRNRRMADGLHADAATGNKI